MGLPLAPPHHLVSEPRPYLWLVNVLGDAWWISSVTRQDGMGGRASYLDEGLATRGWMTMRVH